jgi:hypothetical protein
MVGIAPPDNEELQLGQAPKVHCLGDDAWISQQRILEETVEIQPEKIQITDFLVESEAKPTVIVPDARQYNKFAWNEFPEKPVYDRESVPKVKAQDWVPQNDTEHVVQKTNYQPGRLNAAWPPTENELVKDVGQITRTKAQSDDGWIQQQNPNPEEEEADDSAGNAAWRRQVTKGLKEVSWPPPERGFDKFANEIGGNTKLSAVWPPPEFEEKEQQDVQILQTSFARQKHAYQWPPNSGDGSQAPGEEPVQQYA